MSSALEVMEFTSGLGLWSLTPSALSTMSRELSDGELRDLYSWVDKIPLSRPKRHITRDFSDGGKGTHGNFYVSLCQFACTVFVHMSWRHLCSLNLCSHGCWGCQTFLPKARRPAQLRSCLLQTTEAEQLGRPQQARNIWHVGQKWPARKFDLDWLIHFES